MIMTFLKFQAAFKTFQSLKICNYKNKKNFSHCLTRKLKYNIFQFL